MLLPSDAAIAPPPLFSPSKMAGLRRQNVHVKQSDKARYTEQLGTTMVWIVYAGVAHMRGSMMSETNNHVLYVHFIGDGFGAVFPGGRGRGGRGAHHGITLPR